MAVQLILCFNRGEYLVDKLYDNGIDREVVIKLLKEKLTRYADLRINFNLTGCCSSNPN